MMDAASGGGTNTRFESGYAGPDRRAVAVDPGTPKPRVVVGLVVYLSIWSLVTVLERRSWSFPRQVDGVLLNVLLVSATCVLAVVVGLLYLERWRVIGETVSLRIGIALLLFAGGTYLAHDLVPIVFAVDVDSLEVVRGAVVITVTTVLAHAVIAPEVDSRVRASRFAARVCLGVSGAFVALSMLPPATVPLLGGSHVFPADSSGGLGGQAMVGMAWLAIGLHAILRGLRHRRWLFAWIGTMLVGLAAASVGAASVPDRGDVWLTGAALIELVAMSFAVYGGARELRRAWSSEQRRLLDAQRDLESYQETLESERELQEERIHDARSMLLAIQGAVKNLEEGGERLPSEARVALARALNAEIERLRARITAPEGRTAGSRSFAIDSVVTSVVACHRLDDLGLRVDRCSALEAWGDPGATGEVLHSLLDNARHHAPRSPVTVSIVRELGNVVVRVEDRGPGVRPADREAIFERGRRGGNAVRGGSGLGLYVARRLMRDQGGDLWVEGRPGGGASFVFFLPGSAAGQDDPPVGPSAAPERGSVEVASS